MKKILLLFILSVGRVFAAENAPAPPAALMKLGGLDAFTYAFAKKRVLDVDATLRKLHLEVQSCTFRQFTPLKDFSYAGVGPCLMKAFLKSMKTDVLVGTVYAWISDDQGRLQRIEIQWRPPRGGWAAVIKEFLEMRFEHPLYSLRETLFGEASADRLRYHEFLAGDLKIILPEDRGALPGWASRGLNPWLGSQLAKAQSLSLHLEATRNDQGRVAYSGEIVAAARADSHEDTVVHLRTNMNIVLLSRPFYLHADTHWGPGGDGEVAP